MDAARLHGVCASGAWVEYMLRLRPYRTEAALLAANREATAALDADALREALAGHARIGARRVTEAASRREQAGVTPSAELDAANAAYAERFGHVFLICATGLTAEDVLLALKQRQHHSPARESEVVREELRKINELRLRRLWAEAGAA